MLRIHFTAADIARTRMAPGVDPLWEIVLSLHVLQVAKAPARFRSWRTAAGARASERGLSGGIRHVLFPLAPVASYFPDFLTPAASTEGLAAGIEAVVGTPRARMRAEIGRMASRVRMPGRVRSLAAGDREPRAELGEMLRSYHDAVLSPFRREIAGCVAADRALRMRHLVEGGVEALLRGLWPVARWEPPALVAAYPGDLDVHLDGRGLVLVPSYFCVGLPVALVNPDAQPVLVYPAAEAATTGWANAGGCDESALANLLGPTRAAVLLAIGDGCATKHLVTRAGVSPATVSHHTTVLRDAGLIHSHRVANTVVHVLTPLGARLVGGDG